ncbi:MAG: trigger factor [Bacteroidaceae bacterium]|nr:trigger factor [Bacteroidaceae bacterium]
MNITLEKIDAVNAVITTEITPVDYTDNVKKAIKNFRKKVSLPGFRPGMVPEGLVKKQYGTSILAEEVNKMLQNELYNYIRDNKVNMLGEPMPTADNNNIELVEGNTFTFKFELALAPEIKIDLTSKDKIDFYDIQINDEIITNQTNMYRQRGGKYDKVDSYQEKDMVKGILTELDVENGLNVSDVVMLPEYFKNDDQKKLFNGAKVNDIVKINPSVAYDGSETELSSLLKIDKEQVAEHKGDFNFQITEITRFVLGDLNEELFEQVYPGAGIKTEEEFKQKISDSITEQFKKDSDYRFIIDVRNYLTKKLGKLEFPEEKLKKLMLANANGDQKKVDDNYDKSIEELTWHLIKEQLVEMTQTKVDDKDVKEMAKEVTRMQFAQYGMFNIPDEYLESSVTEMLKKRETVDNLIDRCIELKLSTALKSMVTLNNKSVTPEEFNQLFKD